MNERIKELADQAGVRSIYFNEADNIQRFAELIVRECANIAMREDHDPAECIKKHFGVEE